MCCSFDIGKEAEILFEKNLENASSCKFFGKTIKVEQDFWNGGSPEIISIFVNADFLVKNISSEKFHIKNIFSEVGLIGENHDILDGKIPFVGEKIFGILGKEENIEKIKIFKFYKNEEEYLKTDTEIPFCEFKEKILQIEKIEKNFEEKIIEKNFLENNYFFIIIFLLILNLFLIFMIFLKKIFKK